MDFYIHFFIQQAFFILILGQTSSESVCPYGWQLNENKTLCISFCNAPVDAESEGDLNINCHLLSLKDFIQFDTVKYGFIAMQPGQSLASKSVTYDLPDCYNVTLIASDYNITPNGQYQLNVHIPPVMEYNLLTNKNGIISVCYPLSPQLLQCETETTDPELYNLINGTLLTIPSKNVEAYLGDFYIDSEGIAYTCSQGVKFSLSRYPRCNYIKMKSKEYDVTVKGSIFIPKANFTIYDPLYSFIVNNISLICVPLTIQYINCPIKVGLSPFQEMITTNYSTYSALTRKSYAPDRYFFRDDDLLVICLDEDDTEIDSTALIIQKVHTYICCISAFCLILTLLLKMKLYKNNYLTKCFLFHIVCLIVMYVALSIKYFATMSSTFFCYALFVALYYSYMAAFFWLNVIAYDLWRKLTKLPSPPSLCVCLKPINDQRRFIFYNIYAWGLSFLLLIIVLIIDLSPMPSNISVLNPQISYFCWFNNPSSNGVFYYGPLGLLMLANLIFFILTVCKLHAFKGHASVSESRKMQTFMLAVQLFIMMGLSWIADVICYVLAFANTSNFQTWYISNSIISVNGVAIFLVYCSKILSTSFTNFYQTFVSRPFLASFKDDNVPLHKDARRNNFKSESTVITQHL